MSDSVGDAVFVRGRVALSLAVVVLGACGGASGGGSTTPDGRTLVLQAFGGPAGTVAAQVPLLDPSVGLQQTCAAALDAGECKLTSCQVGGIASPGAEDDYDFGPLSASVDTTTVALSWGGKGYPTVYFPTSTTLGAGGFMTFRGGGGAGVPRFDVSATIPGLASVTSPGPVAGGTAIVDTSRDLSVTWSPIAIGQVHFRLYGGWPGVGTVAFSVGCTFEGASGSGVVSRTLLSSMKEMAGEDPIYSNWSSELDATTVVDGLTIVTQGFLNPPTGNQDFNVKLE